MTTKRERKYFIIKKLVRAKKRNNKYAIIRACATIVRLACEARLKQLQNHPIQRNISYISYDAGSNVDTKKPELWEVGGQIVGRGMRLSNEEFIVNKKPTPPPLLMGLAQQDTSTHFEDSIQCIITAIQTRPPKL